MAAITTWYEFYFEYRYEGKYIFEIEQMHKEFGKKLLEDREIAWMLT